MMYDYPPIRKSLVESTASAFSTDEISLSGFLKNLLFNDTYKSNPCTLDILREATPIMNGFARHPASRPSAMAWAQRVVNDQYMDSIRELIANEQWHFNATHASVSELEDFQIETMAADMRKLAPQLWALLDLLLIGDQKLSAESQSFSSTDSDGDQTMADPLDDDDNAPELPTVSKEEALLTIKKVIIISILMQSRDTKCNALQSIIGIFLHSTSAPEKVIATLARMGISISVSTINMAIDSLSIETRETLREMGQTLLVGYAYDNFDADFKIHVPTIEKSGDTLTHLTSGALIMLEHGVTADDLKCSEELWDKSFLNPKNRGKASSITPQDILKIHPDTPHPSGLNRRERFNAWKFRADLAKYGPQHFESLPNLAPEVVDGIPVVKMRYAPARSMDINESTHAGNISVIDNLLDQGGVGNPDNLTESQKRLQKNISLLQYVVIFFGDLSTYERVVGVLRRRAIEATPYRRFQFVVFVMGLFHLKMAAADAIWRIFLERKESRVDANSMIQFIAKLRKRQTGKYGSGPTFRQMHEAIGHVGAALRLDAWRTEIDRRYEGRFASLADYAASNPSVADISMISEYLARHYVAGGDVDIYELRDESTRDREHENILLMHQYLLLYEELSYSLNQGDVGRLETLFPTWIAVFRGTGKHKYAAHMTSFITDVHFVYPPGLRHAVRYNILVNPTGRPGHFRGVDWVQESIINLFTKSVYGGSGSNYKKERVIKESTLVKIFRNCHKNIERNFHISSTKSTQHAETDITKSLALLLDYMKQQSTNKRNVSRKGSFSVPDVLDIGQTLIYNYADPTSSNSSTPDDTDPASLALDQAIAEEDLAVEYD